MRGLGDSTVQLAKLRKATAPNAGPVRALTPVPEFGPNPGGLTMDVYAPGARKGRAALVVVLHGCTQSPDAYAISGGWIELADQFGLVVVAPGQTAANNPNRCFNWFSPGDTTRGQGEVASIAAMVAYAVKTFDLDETRVFVTGLSAGGAMTMAMLSAYPELFAGGGVIAGLAYGAAGNVPQALAAMRRPDDRDAASLGDLVRAAAPRPARLPRLAIWHGLDDTTVNAANADAIARQWADVCGVQGRSCEPSQQPGRRQELWLSDEGQVLIELNLLPGLGHGAPLATGGPEGVGRPGPYMLEAGVSSSAELCAFWGLKDRVIPASATKRPSTAANTSVDRLAEALGVKVMASVSPHVSPGVQAIIEKALKGAGLLR